MERSGSRSIETSTTVECWPKLARNLRSGSRILTGMVAVRSSVGGCYGCPGLTIVVETPSGGATGALMVVERLGQRGISGCLATQENHGRFGIVRLIYAPFWYAAGEERLFGVDWARWASSAGDQNEGKRIWCEHAAVAVDEVLQELPPQLIDSLLFEEHVAIDRLGLWSKAAIPRRQNTNPKEIGAGGGGAYWLGRVEPEVSEGRRCKVADTSGPPFGRVTNRSVFEEGRRSGGAMIEVEQSAQLLGFANSPVLTTGPLVGERDDIVEPLMIAFVLVVGEILLERVAQGTFAKENQMVETLMLD